MLQNSSGTKERTTHQFLPVAEKSALVFKWQKKKGAEQSQSPRPTHLVKPMTRTNRSNIGFVVANGCSVLLVPIGCHWHLGWTVLTIRRPSVPRKSTRNQRRLGVVGTERVVVRHKTNGVFSRQGADHITPRKIVAAVSRYLAVEYSSSQMSRQRDMSTYYGFAFV
jgi:hypothetical protein